MSISKTIHLLGYASGLAGADLGSADGPLVMHRSSSLAELSKKGLQLEWEDMLAADQTTSQSKLATIADLCQKLARHTHHLTTQKNFFTVIGGDHTSAIGTWSGVHHAIKQQGPLGLIWIDAHMDSHTPYTSLTGNIHGMPLACLLGYGMPSLINLLDNGPKIKPQHLCLIGVRSFERGEAAFLKELNVRIFFMEEVRERGMNEVMKEAIRIVTQGTAGFGVSIDIDSMDPADAPGTGVREPNGIVAKDLCKSLQLLANEPKLLGAEVVEFDPHRDVNHKTEILVSQIIGTLTLGKYYHDVSKSCCFDTADAVV
ncbi:MAG: arginase [Gammaproteobacteria bacterium]